MSDMYGDMMDPVEKAQLDALKQMTEALTQAVQSLETITQQNQQIAQILMADRYIRSKDKDGRPIEAVSSVKNA